MSPLQWAWVIHSVICPDSSQSFQFFVFFPVWKLILPIGRDVKQVDSFWSDYRIKKLALYFKQRSHLSLTVLQNLSRHKRNNLRAAAAIQKAASFVEDLDCGTRRSGIVLWSAVRSFCSAGILPRGQFIYLPKFHYLCIYFCACSATHCAVGYTCYT